MLLKVIVATSVIEWIIQTPGQLNSTITKDHSIFRYGAWRQFTQLITKSEEIVPKFEEAINSENSKVTRDLLLNKLIPLFKRIRVQIGCLQNHIMVCI